MALESSTNTTDCWKKLREKETWKILKKEFKFIISPVLDKSIQETIEISLIEDTFLWMASANKDLDPHYYKYQAEAEDKKRKVRYFVKIHEKEPELSSINLIENLRKEINRQRMATFTSPYLAKLYDVEEDEKFIYFVYEKAQGRSLLKLEEDEIYQRLDERQKEKVIFQIFYQILYGIRGYASNKEHLAIHRDLTPWNIFYNLECDKQLKVDVKIIDFGQMRVEGSSNGPDTEYFEAIPLSPQYARYDYTDDFHRENDDRVTNDIGLDFFSAGMIFIHLFEGKDYFSKEESRKISIRKEELSLARLDRNRISKLCSPTYRSLLGLLDKMTRSNCTMSIEEIVEEYTDFLLDYYKVNNLSNIFYQSKLLIPRKTVRNKKEMMVGFKLCGGKSDGIVKQISLQHGNGVVLDPANHEGCCFSTESRYTKGLIRRAFYLYVWKDVLKCLSLNEKALVNGESIDKIVTLKEKDELSLGVFSITITNIAVIN